MKATRLRERLTAAYRRICFAVQRWDADVDYAEYRDRCAATHEAPLDPGRYFARRLEERYTSRSACC